jgi:hypothetical protein
VKHRYHHAAPILILSSSLLIFASFAPSRFNVSRKG